MKIKLANIKDENNKPLEIDFPENAKGNVPRLHKINTEEKYSNNANEDIGISYQLGDGTKESLSAKPDSEKINLDKFNKITSGVGGDGFLSNNQDSNFGESGLNNFANFGKQIANTAGNLIGADSIANVVNMFDPGEAEQKGLAADIIALEQWKGQKYKDIHTYDWNSKTTLNRSENAANSAMNDLRGELGKTTGGIGGAMAKATNGNVWAQGFGQLADTLMGGASNTNMAGNILGDITGEDVADSAWNTDADELANLNTVTKDTIYTSKPGVRFKAKPGMEQGITDKTFFETDRYALNNDHYESIYGNKIDTVRSNQITSSNFRKSALIYTGYIKAKKLNYKIVKNGDNYVWSMEGDDFDSHNLSTEEIQLITLLKNKNTFNKSLGYIYIRPFYEPKLKNSEKQSNNGFGVFDIPFEFTPRISEGAMQANYQTETLLGRLGQFQIYTGTNLSTLNVELEYQALTPDDFDLIKDNISSNYGTDAWQYYWTNSRIEAIEMQLRSLVLANYTSDYLIKPPLVEIHFGQDERVGDLYKYPNGISNEGKIQKEGGVGSNYLKYSKELGSGAGRYKKYIVNSVQIDNIAETDISYPSLYGRKPNSDYSNLNPMWHLANGDGTKGYQDYARRRAFKATLQLTEVTENFLDLVPDFKAYYDAWHIKSEAADVVNNYVELATGTGKSDIYQSVEDTLKTAVETFRRNGASKEAQIESLYQQAENLAKLYARANNSEKEAIGKYNEKIANFAFLKKLDYGDLDTAKLNEDDIKMFYDGNGFYNFPDGFSINNYSLEKDGNLTEIKNVSTLNTIFEEKEFSRKFYNNESKKFNKKDVLYLFDNNFKNQIYLPNKNDEKENEITNKVDFSTALRMLSDTNKTISKYTYDVRNLEKFQSDIKEYKINNLKNSEGYFIYINNEQKVEKNFSDHFGITSGNISKLKINMKNFLSDEAKRIVDNFSNLFDKNSKEYKEYEKKYNALTSYAGDDLKKLSNYADSLADIVKYVFDKSDKLLLAGTNKADIHFSLKNGSTIPFYYAYEQTAEDGRVAKSDCIPLFKLLKIISYNYKNLQKTEKKTSDEIYRTVDDVETDLKNVDTQAACLKAEAECLTKNAISILGLSNNKLYGITPDTNEELLLTLSYCPYIDANSYIFTDPSYNYYSFDNGEFSCSYHFCSFDSSKLAIQFEALAQIEYKDEIVYNSTYKAISTDIEIISLKDIMKSFADNYSKITGTFEVLPAIYKDYSNGLTAESIENDTRFNKFIEETFGKIAEDIKSTSNSAWVIDDNNCFNFDQKSNKKAILDLSTYKNIAEKITNFLNENGDTTNESNIMRKDWKQKFDRLQVCEKKCEELFSKPKIDERFQVLCKTSDFNAQKLEDNLEGYTTYGNNREDAEKNERYYCYKINNDYALRQLVFKPENVNSISKDTDKTGHGEIYTACIDQLALNQLESKLAKATTTDAIDNYNNLV